MVTSFRDLLITGWVIIFLTTVGVIAFHPTLKGDGWSEVTRIGGFAAIATLGGIVMTLFTDVLGRTGRQVRKTVLVVFVIGMLPLIPVGLATFAIPWGVLILITLIYVRWKWALIPSSE